MKTMTLCSLALFLVALTAGAIPSRPPEVVRPVGVKLHAGKRRGRK